MSKKSNPTPAYVNYLGALGAGIVSIIAAAVLTSLVPVVYLPASALAAYVANGAVMALVLGMGMALFTWFSLGRDRTVKAVLGSVVTIELLGVIVYVLGARVLSVIPTLAMTLTFFVGLIIAACYMVGWKTAKTLV